ncbi:MAG TPA: phenylacetate-CoA oxygenase subunit PaaJ [Gemmatimonadaceae bacterium]|nr:phenylacetate-CoA oxygenase subunit PaaJ [Gemmatimonadaceae bacterium]HRQ77778.1 phenylacetate-CoA oxygenase subunit PaaJ [Gemmatimonadaceae bacterium]
METLSRDRLFEILGTVPDPEVPVISVVELGIVRDATQREDGSVEVTITPTYSGCPAMFEIERDVVAALKCAGVEKVDVKTVLSPAWTTDWISESAREKLRKYGIAPPGPAHDSGLVALVRAKPPVCCPWCGSRNTTLKSEFGSTACKAIHVCNDCKQPFDEFKAI